jgi:hypothetical protein
MTSSNFEHSIFQDLPHGCPHKEADADDLNDKDPNGKIIADLGSSRK